MIDVASLVKIWVALVLLIHLGRCIELYPYGIKEGDEILDKGDDRTSREIKSSVPFPFFDRTYHSVYVNTNGIISFVKPIIQYTPEPFPLKERLRLIAPFWTDVDTNLNAGLVLVRQTTAPQELEVLTKEIQESFPAYTKFKALWALVATWRNVTFYGGNLTSPTNTFQAVILTNGRHSFAIFNYDTLTWTTGTASAGNTSGLGGRPAQAGFNAGDGRRYFNLPGSRTNKVLEVTNLSNVKKPGRWIFRVDDHKIRNGGCNTKGSLIIQPSSGSMLGGETINITGPCFTKGQAKRLKCMMAKAVVQAIMSPDGNTATCTTPLFPGAGKIPIFLSLDDGDTFPFYGVYISTSPENTRPGVTRRTMLKWNQPEGPYIIQWDPEKFPKVEELDVDLMGYKLENGQLVPKYYPIAHDVPNRGHFYVDTWRLDHRARDIYVGAIRLTPKRDRSEEIDLRNTPSLWTDLHVLGWFLKGDKPDAEFEAQAAHMCSDWLEAEKRRAVQMVGLPTCPCDSTQASRDLLWFERDPVCAKSDYYFPLEPDRLGCPAKGNGTWSCYRSIFPSENGAGQQCCYKKNGELLLSQRGDQGAGSIKLAHPKGSIESSDPRDQDPIRRGIRDFHLPMVSNMLIDELPEMACCRWSKNACQEYRSRRPSDDCQGYEPPRIGAGYGDPHIITLDGLGYTFNGLGEFTILTLNDTTFTIQGRTVRSEDVEGSLLNATSWNALAFKDRDQAPVHVEYNERRLLDVYIDGERLDQDEENDLLRNYYSKGLDIKRNAQDSLHITFESGINVQINATEGTLLFKILVPKKFKGLSKGLLGIWNDDINDDLTSRDNITIPIDSVPQTIYQDFGLSWSLTNPKESILMYHEGYSFESFDNLRQNFVPTFDWSSQLDDATLELIKVTCGTNAECAYDLALTGNVRLAKISKAIFQDFKEAYADTVRLYSTNRVCPVLPIPANGTKFSEVPIPGGLATFGCQVNYTMAGSGERICSNNGSWLGEETTCTKPQKSRYRIRTFISKPGK